VQDIIFSWLANLPSLAVPYALASLGLIIGERSGVLSLGAEGLMLVGALAGVGAYLSFGGYPLLSLIVAMIAAALVSLLFAALVVLLRVNQVIAGLALVFFCQGMTNLIGTVADWSNHTITGLRDFPLYPLSALPVIGRLLFTHDLIVYLTIPIFIAVSYFLNRTNVGLRLRAIGESPEAADAAGLNIYLYRFAAVVGGSALVGLAGGYLSVASAKIWIAGMTSGRGWIAVALVIFARWHPWRALLGALLFGGIEALIPQVAAAGIRVPQYFMLMTPYLATLAVMVWQGVRGRIGSDGPAALGQPYVREERT
jgi:general nucleoside transport system permease protein